MSVEQILGIGCPLLAVVVVGIYAVVVYNRLVRNRNAYQNAFAQIDVQLIRRHDLIPNLVETAKGYLAHERETLQQVLTHCRLDAPPSWLEDKAAVIRFPSYYRPRFTTDELAIIERHTAATARRFGYLAQSEDLSPNPTDPATLDAR